ncbi:hypothetical protein FKW77_003641 [Venturia effusa]|uniref:Uncharacterized protein n=1 Tax=Venturia effusa TaxID=50376 RepID=A0A517LF90_9PEZI|nr:hypothetical protein FKW77_003641 [Venturia effusa]
MAASVAYLAGDVLEDELRKQKTPRLTTGSDNWCTHHTRDICDLEFTLACIHMQYAISSRDVKRPLLRKAENTRAAQQSVPCENFFWIPPTLPAGTPPPPYEETTAELPPDYTNTDSVALRLTQETDLPPRYVSCVARRTGSLFALDPLITPRVDLTSLHNIRAHAKKKANKSKAAAAPSSEKKSEPPGEEKTDEGDKGSGNGGSGGGGNGGNGNGGDDWGDDGWGKKDDKKGKKKKQQEEEDKKKEEEEEEAKRRADEEAAATANDEWGDADNTWGSFASKKSKKTIEKAEETVAASTNIWADNAAAPEKDDGFGFLAGTGLGTGKKKGKKSKALAEEVTPATESFQDISLNDEHDLGVPKISLSFEESAAPSKKEESSSGFGLGWGSSWSFGGIGGAKKEAEKPKSPGGWVKSTLGEFNFGFGVGSSSEAKDTSKKDDDDDDNLLPSWGTAGISTAAKKEKTSSMFGGIEEVDNTKDWGGWGSKKEDDKKSAVKSWDTWGSSTIKTDKKMSWGNFDEEEEDKVDSLPVVKEDENAGSWGSLTSKSKPKLKKGALEMTPKEDVWGWAANDGKGKTANTKDDDYWGEFASTNKDTKEEAASSAPPLSILKGLTVSANGKIENLLGEVVGELIEEDMVHASKCARMMYLCDEEGKIKNTKGKLIATAKTIGSAGEPEPAPVIELESDRPAEAPEPEQQAELPDISILDSLQVQPDGKILDHNGVEVGELIQGDAKAINKKKFACNTRGEFRDKKWNLLGQARVLPTSLGTVAENAPEPDQVVEDVVLEDTKGSELPDISILQGLKLEADGKLLNDGGIAVGELIDGDAPLIIRRKYACTAEGTFVDKKLRVVGRCQTLPVPITNMPNDEPEPEKESEPDPQPSIEPEISFETPDLSILKNLPCEKDGKIMGPDGVAIGELIEGDAKVIAKRFILCDAEGVFKSGKKILGKAQVIPIEVTKAPESQAAEEVPEPGQIGEAGSTELPPLSILEGLTIEPNGTILSRDKVVVGKVVEGDAMKFASMMYDCDAEGNVINFTGLPVGKAVTIATSGAMASTDEPAENDKPMDGQEVQEAPPITAEPPPLSILKGCHIEADGSVLDTDGVVIGKVVEGDPVRFQSISAKCDGEGNVIGAKKKKVGKVQTVAPEPQPTADETTVEDETLAAEIVDNLVPETALELIDEAVSLEILDGRMIGLSGDVVDDDGNLIGRLIEGDAKKLNKAKAKCDAKGNVVDKKGKQLGKVEVVQPEKAEPPAIVDEPEKEGDVVEETVQEMVEEPVSLDILKGRTIEVSGEIFDQDFKVIGRLIEGDPKKLNKSKAKCDAEGNVIDKKGKQVGKAEVIQPETIEVSGVVDVPVEPEIPEAVEELKKEEEVSFTDAPLSLEILKGRTIEASGDILDDDMNIIGKLIDGNAKKLNKGQAKCDGEGNVMMKNKVAGKVEVIQPQLPETHAESVKEEEPTTEAPDSAAETPAISKPLTLADLENLSLDEVGDVYNNDGVLVGRLVEGSGNAKKLYAKYAYCDHEGNVWGNDEKKAKGRVEVVQPEIQEIETSQADASPEPEQPASKPITLEDLEGRTIELNGDILNDDGQVIGKLVKGFADKLFKAKAKCDDNGGVFHKDKKVGSVEVVQPELSPEGPIEEVITPIPLPPEEVAEPEIQKPVTPTFALVDGRKIEKTGEVLDDDGNVIAKLSKGSGSKLFKAGATCHADGTIWAKMKQVKDATLELVLPELPEDVVPEIPAPPLPPPPPEPPIIEDEPASTEEPPSFASLAGIKVDKFGEFLDADNVLVARLATGNISKLYKAGATCDAEGKVWAKGKIDKTATVELVFQDEPEAQAPEVPEALPAPPTDDPEPEPELEKPKVSKYAKLDGLKIDKYGEIRDNNFDIIAKLVKGTGDPKKLAKEKAVCDGEGNLVIKGVIVKDAKIAFEPGFDEVEETSAAPEPEVVDQEPELIPKPEPEPETSNSKYAKLEGLKIDGFGEIMDNNWECVARLVSGNAARLSKQGATIDANGNVVVKGKVVKDAKIELEGAEEEAGKTEEIPEEAPESEIVPEPEPEAIAEPQKPDFSKAEGLKIDKHGDIMDKNSTLIAKLVEGDAKKLAKDKATCDAKGNVLVKNKIVKGARIEMQFSEEEPPKVEEPIVEEPIVEEPIVEEPIVEEPIVEEPIVEEPTVATFLDDPPAEPERPAGPSFATIEGSKIDRFGDIFDDDYNVIATLVEGDAAKLHTRGAVCGPNGTVIVKGKTAKNARVELKIQEPMADPEPEAETVENLVVEAVEEEKEDLSKFEKLVGLRIDKSGEVWDKGWNLVAKLAEGDAKSLAKDRAVCDGEGNLLVKGNIVDGAKVRLIEDFDGEVPGLGEESPAVPEVPALTLASLEGKELEEDGTIIDDNGKIIGKLVSGESKLAMLRKAKAKCDGEGNLIAKSKVVPKCKVEIVLPEPEEPAALPEPAATKEVDDWFGDDWGAPKKDKEVKKGTVKSRLAVFENADSTWGDPFATLTTKKKPEDNKSSISAGKSAVSKTKASAFDWGSSWDTPAGTKEEEEPVKEESGWGASFGWGSSKKKVEDPIDESKIMKAAVEEPKSDDSKDTSGFAFLNKKDKKKKASKNAPVEVIDDTPDVPLHESATLEETKSNAEEDPDWAFASNRVKAKKGKKGATANEDDKFARAPSPPEEEAMKAIEAPPETKKSKKSKKKATADDVELSKSTTKESAKSKASDKPNDLIDIGEGEDEDDLAPDDSASVTKEPKEAPIEEKKEEKKSSGWGAMFGFGAPAKPTLAQLRKEREERERKDKEERESAEQQEREEKERLERQRIDEERIEQERLEQEERDKALEEAAKARKEEEDMYASTTKKSKKTSKKTGKGKVVEVAPPAPPPPPPVPAQSAEKSGDEESDKDDPFAGWGSKGKSSTKKSAKKDAANEKASLSKSAKKVPEEDELLPTITNDLKSASASATKDIKTSSSTTKSATAGLSVAERIKALKGETKLKEAAALTPPVPPPPPAPPVEAKLEAKPSKDKGIDVTVESSSKKLSKKQTSSSKAAAAKLAAKKKTPEPEPEVVVLEKKPSKTKAPGGFPGSDESSYSELDDPIVAPAPEVDEEALIDLTPPTPPPEADMGAKAATKSSKKSATNKKSAKSKATSKPTKAANAVAKKIVDTSTESESETEVEQEKAAVNAEGTQGSGSTTAVDSQADGKLPTPPPDAKTMSPVKKERAKVVRSTTGGSAWGLWGVSTPKQIRDRAKQATPAPAPKASANAKPMMVRPRTARKESVSASAAAASGAESDKKTTSPPKPAKPVPKRAPTFSLFGSAPTPRKTVRAAATPRSRPQSRRTSPSRTDGTKTEGDDELPRVSSKAAKVMGIRARGGPSASRRVKSKGKLAEIAPRKEIRCSPSKENNSNTQRIGPPDPYAIDDEPVMVDNGLETYAESSPVGAKKPKGKSVAEATSSTNDDGILVDVDASEGTRGIAADSQERPFGRRSRKPSPTKRRSQSRHNPRTSSGGIMGLFSGLSRSKTVKEPRTSDPTFSASRSRRDDYGSDDGSGNRDKRMSGAFDDNFEQRQRRRRKSRRDTAVDDEGFTTDAPGATTDYEEADRQRAERRAARRAEERRNAEDARANEERAARRRERDQEKERDREARRIARAEQIRQEEEARRREEKEARRAARRIRDEERMREEEQARLDEQERIEKEERRARRRAQKERDRDRDMPRESEREDRPSGHRRKSSYMDSKRTPGDRSSRRISRADPIEYYFDPRNAGQSSQATPYLGSDKDKTSSWVESLSKDNPLPLAPEDTATVIEPTPGEEPNSTDEEEVRRKMQQRSRRRGESYRDSAAPRESNRERSDRPRDADGKRERRRRTDRGPEVAGLRSSESGDEKQRRRRSVYQDLPEEYAPRVSRRNTYQDYGFVDGDERPSQNRRASWFKKIF